MNFADTNLRKIFVKNKKTLIWVICFALIKEIIYICKLWEDLKHSTVLRN